jgi:hypothetical protein
LKNNGIRSQVFEVIVRQAIAGARWREICAVAMQANQITPEQIEEEIRRRQGGVERPSAPVPKRSGPIE